MLAHLGEGDLGRAVRHSLKPPPLAALSTGPVHVALERQNKIDNGSAESSRNGPHRRIEPVLGGLGFK